jgi:hypothetical protein
MKVGSDLKLIPLVLFSAVVRLPYLGLTPRVFPKVLSQVVRTWMPAYVRSWGSGEFSWSICAVSTRFSWVVDIRGHQESHILRELPPFTRKPTAQFPALLQTI